MSNLERIEISYTNGGCVVLTDGAEDVVKTYLQHRQVQSVKIIERMTITEAERYFDVRGIWSERS